MLSGNEKKRLIEYLLIFIAAALLYSMQFVFFLFLIPLQILYYRHGIKAFLTVAATQLVFISIISMSRMSANGAVPDGGVLVVIEVGICFLLMVGLAICNVDWSISYKNIVIRRVFYKLIIASTVIGVAGALLYRLVDRDGTVSELVNQQIMQMMQMLFTNPDGTAMVNVASQSDVIYAKTMEVLAGTFVFSFFIILSVSWRLATAIDRRMRRIPPMSLCDFHIPAVWIWGLIISLVGTVIGSMAGVHVITIPLMNAFSIILFGYTLQGIGILKYLLQKQIIPTRFRFVIIGTIILVLFIPAVRIIPFIAFPGLGVSETWINYRTKERSQNNENYPE